MADAVATQTIQDGAKTAIFRFTNVSDGTGESAVTKVDVSALSANPAGGAACAEVRINKIWFSTIGLSVKILFDASTDTLAIELPPNYSDTIDFSSFGGLVNTASSPTGDIMFTTVGHGAGDTYSIVLECAKTY